MLIGAHSIIYSTNPDADRVFLRDVLKLTHVDVGDGWLIFGLPPAEVAVHPSDKNDVHEFYLMCDDVEAFVAGMQQHNIACASVQDRGWGLLTQLTLPGGGKLGVYQPRHARPKPLGDSGTAKKPVRTQPESPRSRALAVVRRKKAEPVDAFALRKLCRLRRGRCVICGLTLWALSTGGAHPR